MARNEVIELEEDEGRGKVVIGVPKTVENKLKVVQQKAVKMKLLRSVNNALADKMAEAIELVDAALDAKQNGHSLMTVNGGKQ